MFSYLRVPDHIAKFNGNCRTTPCLVNYTSRLKENKVDRSSFSMMKPADDLKTQTSRKAYVEGKASKGLAFKHGLYEKPTL